MTVPTRLEALVAFLLAAAMPHAAVAGEVAQSVYFGGSILTMAGDKPAYVEALAVKDGKILFAGSKDQTFRL